MRFRDWKGDSCIQETIRFDTVVPHLFREATRNEVIPLSEQVRCRSGTITPKNSTFLREPISSFLARRITGGDI